MKATDAQWDMMYLDDLVTSALGSEEYAFSSKITTGAYTERKGDGPFLVNVQGWWNSLQEYIVSRTGHNYLRDLV